MSATAAGTPQGACSRRTFLRACAVLGGGAAFDLCMPFAAVADAAATTAVEIHSWVVVHANDRVTVRIPQAELGQGISTALVQVIAEELELDLALTDWEFYDPQTNRERHNVYVHTATLASWGAEMLFGPMRTAGAQIRSMLRAAAAQSLGVEVAKLVREGHRFRAGVDGATIGFGAIAAAAAAQPVPAMESSVFTTNTLSSPWMTTRCEPKFKSKLL